MTAPPHKFRTTPILPPQTRLSPLPQLSSHNHRVRLAHSHTALSHPPSLKDITNQTLPPLPNNLPSTSLNKLDKNLPSSTQLKRFPQRRSPPHLPWVGQPGSGDPPSRCTAAGSQSSRRSYPDSFASPPGWLPPGLCRGRWGPRRFVSWSSAPLASPARRPSPSCTARSRRVKEKRNWLQRQTKFALTKLSRKHNRFASHLNHHWYKKHLIRPQIGLNSRKRKVTH